MKTLIILLSLITVGAKGQTSVGPDAGYLILTGGDYVPEALAKFVELAGGDQSRFVYVPTAASSIRLPSGFIYNPDSTAKLQQFSDELSRLFKVKSITVLHTRDRKTADETAFVSAIANADGVWLGAGNSGRLAETYLNTKVVGELRRLLARGKVIGGHSAGSIIQGSFVVRGRYDKPLLMPTGRTTGFGFLQQVVINPHLTSAKRENELVDVLDAHPELLGMGMDDNAAVVVHRDIMEPLSEGRIAIYDNIKHGGSWYYWLKPMQKFNLRTRSVMD